MPQRKLVYVDHSPRRQEMQQPYERDYSSNGGAANSARQLHYES